jgi:hypothetical protein
MVYLGVEAVSVQHDGGEVRGPVHLGHLLLQLRYTHLDRPEHTSQHLQPGQLLLVTLILQYSNSMTNLTEDQVVQLLVAEVVH